MLKLLVAMAVLVLLGAFAARRARGTPPAEVEARERDYTARLLKPQWTALSALAGTAPVPEMLRELYEDRALVLGTGLDVVDPRLSGGEDAVWSVDRFCPADREAIAAQRKELPQKSFTFAECEGDPYYVILGGSSADGGPVYHLYADRRETVTVAPTLATFLACCRAARLRANEGEEA